MSRQKKKKVNEERCVAVLLDACGHTHSLPSLNSNSSHADESSVPVDGYEQLYFGKVPPSKRLPK